MVFLGLTRPSPASRRVATDYGASRGFNYEHVGASRHQPHHSPAPIPTQSERTEKTDGISNPDLSGGQRGGGGSGGWRVPAVPYATDRNFARVGTGKEDFVAARGFMSRWGHFQLGWSEVDATTGTARGDDVCVCANVLGVWIRNPLQVVYNDGGEGAGVGAGKGQKRHGSGGGGGGEGAECKERFSFAHGCLDGHLLAGEESFVLERRADDSVWYGVQTFSRPAHPLAFLGYPAVRLLQWRFARDSMRAVQRGVEEARGGGGGGGGAGGGAGGIRRG